MASAAKAARPPSAAFFQNLRDMIFPPAGRAGFSMLIVRQGPACVWRL